LFDNITSRFQATSRATYNLIKNARFYKNNQKHNYLNKYKKEFYLLINLAELDLLLEVLGIITFSIFNLSYMGINVTPSKVFFFLSTLSSLK